MQPIGLCIGWVYHGDFLKLGLINEYSFLCKADLSTFSSELMSNELLLCFCEFVDNTDYVIDLVDNQDIIQPVLWAGTQVIWQSVHDLYIWNGIQTSQCK